LDPFVLTQKEGKKRVCFDLSEVGGFLANTSFCMEGVREAKMYMRKGIYMCKIDLKDAYHSVSVSSYASRYLSFAHKNIL
jgi:hypothetical protein